MSPSHCHTPHHTLAASCTWTPKIHQPTRSLASGNALLQSMAITHCQAPHPCKLLPPTEACPPRSLTITARPHRKPLGNQQPPLRMYAQHVKCHILDSRSFTGRLVCGLRKLVEIQAYSISQQTMAEWRLWILPSKCIWSNLETARIVPMVPQLPIKRWARTRLEYCYPVQGGSEIIGPADLRNEGWSNIVQEILALWMGVARGNKLRFYAKQQWALNA